jgi:hypothetical protein
MRRSSHVRSWSVLIAATGTLMLVGCNSTDAGDGVTAGASNANGGATQQSSGGAKDSATGGKTAASSGGAMPSSGGQLFTGGTTASSSGGLPSSGGTTTVATGGKVSNSGGASTGGVSAQAGGVAGAAQAGSAGAVEPDFKCQSDDDCCAVVDNCYNTMTVVGLPYKAATEARIAAYPPTTMCNSCIPPQVQVTCLNGLCLGYKAGSGTTWPGSGLSGTHCGVLSTGGTSGVSASVERAEPIVAAFGGAASTGGASSTGGKASSGGASTGGKSSTLGQNFSCLS